MATKNVGNAEYDFVPPHAQAAGRAVCPFCMTWHSRATGAPLVGEDCKAYYVRVRRVGIVVRGKPTGFGTGFRSPDENELKACLVHASNIVAS